MRKDKFSNYDEFEKKLEREMRTKDKFSNYDKFERLV